MTPSLRLLCLLLPSCAGAALFAAGQAPAVAEASRQGQTEISLVISADPGAPPRYAVPDFIALSSDAETVAVAKVIGQVLWDDLAYERELYMIARDTYASIPTARSVEAIAFDRWRELGADGLVFGTVRKVDGQVRVEARLFSVRSRQAVFSQQYDGGAGNPRLFAHTIADELHREQRGLGGVARTKLAFSSDRDGDRVVGTVEKRDVKEIYIADYDGANARRLTVNRNLNTFPVWTPDARGVLYTSYVRGYPELVLSRIYEGLLLEPTRNHARDVQGFAPQSFLGVVSPDGKRVCFASNRDGNSELYIMNLDGTGLFRLTNHPAQDITPTWNAQGTQVAFTSDRRGQPAIYIIGADGTNLTALTTDGYADRATWSPLGTEIAYASRTGPGLDIKVVELATRQVRQLTFGEGTNESPAFSPNGRHLAFTSTRAGRVQVFTMARDGRDVRQITRTGNNFYPNWSPQ